jgi:hypothetical protein
MSNNKDLAKELQAMRLKAKEAASSESTSEPAQLPSVPPTPTPKVLSSPKPRPQKQGRGAPPNIASSPATPNLERTTITLKTGDNAALSELQTFLMQRDRKAASTSTIIRLALLYTKQALTSDADALAKVYTQILKGDGRRRVQNSK